MDNEKFIKSVNKLIVKIAHGDNRALDLLFDLTKKPLFSVAKIYLFDKSKAEDVLSETYLKVVRGAAYFNKTKNGFNWMYEITKNTALNENRNDNVNVKPLEDNDVAEEFIDELLTKITVKNAVEKLLSEERRLIYEYFFARRTLREIAESEGKSKTRIQEKIMKILKKLKEILK